MVKEYHSGKYDSNYLAVMMTKLVAEALERWNDDSNSRNVGLTVPVVLLCHLLVWKFLHWCCWCGGSSGSSENGVPIHGKEESNSTLLQL